MITNYYTLHALVEEWQGIIDGLRVVDGFSQEKDELTLAFAGDSAETMIRLSVRSPMQYVFRVDGYSKARRNVATLFGEASGRAVTGVRIAERDRIIYIDLTGGLYFQILLFGPRANVFLAARDGHIRSAFQNSGKFEGEPAATPRPAPMVGDVDDFLDRWPTNRKTVEQALSSAMPLLDRALAREAALRAGVDPEAKPEIDETSLRGLYREAAQLESVIQQPDPIIYWNGRQPVQFSLVPLSGMDDLREERFESVDKAVGVFVRSTLAQIHFDRIYQPVEKALAAAAEHYRTSLARMLDELSRESRADQYERFGHLLMANPGAVPAGAESVELPDLFTEGETAQIKLDPSKSAVENAEALYDRARRTRRSREEAEKRLLETEELGERAAGLLEELHALETLKDVRDFRRGRQGDLARFMPEAESRDDRMPFRRFDLGRGYEVWVGRNARQNDELTFSHAQKYDLWMHARGSPGSHAVLRLPGRGAQPDGLIIRKAAAIAAYFSKARGSGLVPVIVVERKYVRKPRGSDPGVVVVEREDVILVEPGLPS
jgi:predicted ribosome quality control (RQC) complex YloA/Tae2 family protein